MRAMGAKKRLRGKKNVSVGCWTVIGGLVGRGGLGFMSAGFYLSGGGCGWVGGILNLGGAWRSELYGAEGGCSHTMHAVGTFWVSRK